MAQTSFKDLPRNDTTKAIELAKHLLKINKLTPEATHVLLMHQDSSQELLSELELLVTESKKK